MSLFDRKREPCLPQDEPKPEQRQSALEEAREAYRYTYAKPNLRGVAMAAEPPKSDNPGPAWLLSVAGAATKIVDNARSEAAAEGETPRSELLALLAKIGVEGIRPAFEELAEAVTRGKDRGTPARLAEYAEMFRAWPLPAIATEHHLDSSFARMRLAGANPAWIRRVDPSVGLPDDFGVEARHFEAAIGEGDSLEAALAEGRLFSCEYRQLLGAKPGCNPTPAAIELDYEADPAAWDAAYRAREAAYAEGAQPKQVVAPLVLFTVPPGGGALQPVAIQLVPNGQGRGRQHVFTPRDGGGWLAAKLAVGAADSNVHEAIAHLGTTHLVQEAFMLAMHNCLAPQHPLTQLLLPHFEGTVNINASADAALVAADGSVDHLLMPTIGETIRISYEGLRAWNFNEQIFPRQLEQRGVADAELLPDYPYRDDGLLVWAALEQWVRDYIHHYYRGDAEVAADLELQAFVAQVGAYRVEDAKGREVGGGIAGVGEGQGGVATRAYLVQMITQIIWNGSAQHAAVNFPQAHEMAYAPMYSLALVGELPSGPRFEEAALLRMLTPRELAQEQLVILELLGTAYHTRLGHYPDKPTRPWFGKGPVRTFEQALQARLDQVEATIDERNRQRPSYRYLRPSEIPQSINI